MLGAGAADQVQEVTVIGQELRVPMRGFLSRSVQLSDVFRRTAARRDSTQPFAVQYGKENVVTTTPGAGDSARRLAKCFRRSAGWTNLLQLALRKKADEPSVGRPKWRARHTRGARQSLGRQRIEIADPDKACA